MRPAVCKKSDPLLFSDFQNYPVRPFPCPAATMAANPIAPPPHFHGLRAGRNLIFFLFLGHVETSQGR
jgi:hypothetical protein